jgi:hypothetical protein
MTEKDDGFGLAEAISVLRAELLKAHDAGTQADIQLPITSMTVELTVTATRSKGGTFGFRVPVIDLEVGADVGRERGVNQSVTVVFAPPVGRDGTPYVVDRPGDQTLMG